MKKSNKRSKKADNKLTSKELQRAIQKLFKENPDKKLSPSLIIKILGISNNKDSVKYALEQLNQLPATEAQKVLKEPTAPLPFVEKGVKVRQKVDTGHVNHYEGVVDMTKSGTAYIVCEGSDSDIYVPSKHLNTAMHGDKVRVAVFAGSRGRRRPEGEIVKIIERASESFIGSLMLTDKHAVVTPDRLDAPDVRVPFDALKGAEDGMKVVVKVTDWQGIKGRNGHLKGDITAVLGYPGSSDIEMKAILINAGFNIEFPEEVLAEAERISDDIASEVPKRRDFRDITTFTIDPFDAKDFDDALSFRRLENGDIEVGVHIADVSHYIQPQTALDKEAYLRATSVYLVDRVCPMLPERLSNELCSLRPNEEKLTFSAVFTFDDKYSIKSKWFGKTIIYSDRRFTYEEAQQVLETGEGDYAIELLELNKIAYHLRKKRFKNGAINFETDEVKFKLDENGVPVEVFVKERKDAHLLIEDFMLLANRSVAEYMAKKEALEVPYVYRIHDMPNMEKLENFALFAREMGVKMVLDTPQSIAKSLNDLVKKAEKDDNLKLLMPIAIRCMAKAVYSTNNIGHYGLAFEYYSHFTSPIRRYSDVFAHRILFENLQKTVRVDKEQLEAQCKHISGQERKAAEAERASVKYKQVEYMKNHIGETFEGVVSGMLERGIFVEIKHMLAEGLVTFDKMAEAFEIDSARLKARGLRTGRLFKMGDAVQVRIIGADLEKRQIDMILAE